MCRGGRDRHTGLSRPVQPGDLYSQHWKQDEVADVPCIDFRSIGLQQRDTHGMCAPKSRNGQAVLPEIRRIGCLPNQERRYDYV